MVQAVQAYKNVLLTEDFKEAERLRERARHNEAAALGSARRKERAEIARKMKADGVPFDTIQKYTGIEIDVISTL
jgi:hypothetical protein